MAALMRTSNCVRSLAASQGALAALMGRVASPALFALVGASNTLVDIGLFWLLTELVQVPPLPANAVSFSLGAANSFVLNRLLTFRNRHTRRTAVGQLFVFALVTLACLAVSSLILSLALPLMPSLAAKLISTAATFVFAYTLASRLVFR
ncbi:MAG: GtrA family protein [Hyphomicrobiaceae bacterium]|nr:MAG: GtrA family protein [Hyphomicrobiaceae bacterium]